MDDDANQDIEPRIECWEDRFTDMHHVGSGKNALVFYAWDAHLERAVAFKIAKPSEFRAEELDMVEDLLQPSGLLADFTDQLRADAHIKTRYTLRREGQLLAKIDHPNVVPVHDLGEVNDDDETLLLPYLGGGTLDERELPEPWEEVLDILIQIGRGLAAIHANGILHRDFKPNNVMFDGEGRPVIVDLGLACRLDDAEAMADWAGSFFYTAPEVLRQEFRDVRDDVYAFSVVAFETFYRGQFPFASAKARDAGLVNRPVREAGMSQAVHDVIVRGLAPDPDERWPDMPTMLRALEAARDRTVAKARRRPWPAAIAWAAAAVVIGLSLSVPEVRASSCDELGDELDAIWNDEVRADLREALGTRKAGDALQDWVGRWAAVRGQECEAARPSWDNPWGRDPGPTPCSASLRDRFTSTIRAFEAPHLREQLAFTAVLAELPAPEHCLDHPDAADWGHGGPIALRDLDVEVEALLTMGDLDLARARLDDYATAAREQGSEHGSTRAQLWRAELDRLEGRLDDAARGFNAVYEQAWELDLPALAAEAMLKLVAVAGERGQVGVVNAYALAARGMVEALRPEQTAELLRVQGLALGGEQGLPLLARAVELREAALREHPGTRELLSQAQESYARGLLDVGCAHAALPLLDAALRTHQDEFGHGTWRTREIARQMFLAHIVLENWRRLEDDLRTILDADNEQRDWPRYASDVLWASTVYQRHGERDRAVRALLFGRAHLEQQGTRSEVDRIDEELSKYQISEMAEP